MSDLRAPFVVVGAGQAGSWVARTLRAEGFTGRIVLIGEEAHAPYERPPLSKSLLSGASDIGSATLLSVQQASDANIELWTSTRVEQINRDARTLACADGRLLSYDRLFLTMGGKPRLLEGCAASADRTHVLRTLDDAVRLRAALSKSRSLVVVGGGWIGLEVAATARQMGVAATVIEAGPALCARSLPQDISSYLLALHGENGVDVRLGAVIKSISDSTTGVLVDLGHEQIAADQLLVGIGMEPNVQLAAAVGLEIGDGIIVDETGQTSDQRIYAAGDVTFQPSWLLAGQVRLESWANAQNQAIVAAKSALGLGASHQEAPWIWSDQFSVSLQIAGHPELASTLHPRGAPSAGKGCWLALDAKGRAIGGVGVNAPKELRFLRKHLQERTTPEAGSWSDDMAPLNKIPAV